MILIPLHLHSHSSYKFWLLQSSSEIQGHGDAQMGRRGERIQTETQTPPEERATESKIQWGSQTLGTYVPASPRLGVFLMKLCHFDSFPSFTPNFSTKPLNPLHPQNLTAPHSTLLTALPLIPSLASQPPPQVPQPYAGADAR